MFRRLQLFVLGALLVLGAFSTGLPFLFYLVYLAVLVVGGSYVLTRLGLADLEAGYAVSQLSGHVGERLRVTYTLRSASRVPKLWLEIHNPTSLPAGLPGRAMTLGPERERSTTVLARCSWPGTSSRTSAPCWSFTSGSRRARRATPPPRPGGASGRAVAGRIGRPPLPRSSMADLFRRARR